MTIEIMKQALEALEDANEMAYSEFSAENLYGEAITSLRQAIEQAEKEQQRESLGVCLKCGANECGSRDCPINAQTQREWVGLTDEERNHARQTITYSQLAMTAGEWTEAVQIETERRLKEKNT